MHHVAAMTVISDHVAAQTIVSDYEILVNSCWHW